jgi:hypothetical protein
MFDFLESAVAGGPPVSARDAVVRLVAALVLGWLVAWIYRRTRPAGRATGSLPGTLVLLSVLIAIVTQVVGTNAARAFSLVGALSIVRFRTVVQDTQDTAFVIFAVVMGMAVGASDIWMSVVGLLVVGGAAFLMRTKDTVVTPEAEYSLTLRAGLGHDVETLLKEPFGAHVGAHRLVSMETARQGTAVEASYMLTFRSGGSPEGLVKALNRIEGVQNVQLQIRDDDDD